MAWVDFPLDRFEWVGAEPRWYNTWPTTRRGFCDECGSTIAAIDEDGTAMGVTIMSLDGPTGLVPEHQSFKDNAVSWLPVIGTGSD